MKKAMQNIADGTDGEELRILLEDEIESNAAPMRSASAFFMGLGGFAPTVGIIGTVVSLTHVLANLGKPDELGPLIASAFVATLWVPFYNRTTPNVAGFPFFFWWQLLWVLITAVLMLVAYFVVRREELRYRAARPTAETGGPGDEEPRA